MKFKKLHVTVYGVDLYVEAGVDTKMVREELKRISEMDSKKEKDSMKSFLEMLNPNSPINKSI